MAEASRAGKGRQRHKAARAAAIASQQRAPVKKIQQKAVAFAPDYSLERRAIKRHHGLVAGVDEAGRGPLAGPVVSAAVVFLDERVIPAGLNDSKKLSEDMRERLYDQLREGEVLGRVIIGLGIGGIERIDRDNILAASLWSMGEAVSQLAAVPACCLIDGNRLPRLAMAGEALIKGDGRSLSIAAASIVAKVTRDRMMRQLDEAFPQYKWASNKGYGTRDHREALQRYGVSPHHRRSFEPVRVLLEAGV